MSDTPSGLLILDKPVGPTSMALCRRVRAALVRAGAPKRIKVGHGGTLDPLASGLVVILVGKATRLCESIMAGDKRYLAHVDLSKTSTTDDYEGETTHVPVETPPTEDALLEAITTFVGEIQQAPPAHSAIKVDGERAYDLARKGALDTLPTRQVRIDSIALTDYAWPHATLDIRCGKGVYIRSLARDLGRTLRTGGMLSGLRRTQVGRFSTARALPFDQLPTHLTQLHLTQPHDPA